MNGDKNRPNIVLITTDTQRTDTLGCMGSTFAFSPNIDRLAAEGVLFERSYTAAPACMPARCSILSGLYAPLHGCIENGVKRYNGIPVFTDTLKELGYKTMMFGKTHFGPIPDSFDIAEITGGEKQNIRHDFYSGYFEKAGYPENSGWPNPVPEEYHLDSLITDRVIYHMTQEKNTDTPFFAFCSLLSPHSPLDPPGKWGTLYEPSDMPEPHFNQEEWKNLPESLQRLCGLSEKKEQEEKDWIAPLREAKGTVADHVDIKALKRYKALYYGSAAFCDSLIGRILDFLDKSGLRKNTLVIFTSDHGQQYFDHSFNNKHNFYEETSRVPLIFSLPSVLPQGMRREFASTVDLAPTIIGAAGGNYAAANGFDLFTPLKNGEEMPRTCAVSTIQRSMALVAGDYKLEYYMDDNRVRLFDVKKDPREDHDLAGDVVYEKLCGQLLQALLLWRMELTDIHDLHGRLEAGGPVAVRAVKRLRELVGNECDIKLGRNVEKILAK